jgi:hypothetical protein
MPSPSRLVKLGARRAPALNLTKEIGGSNRQRRRQRLIDEAVRKHGVLGIGALLRALENECGDLGIDHRLECLVDADERAICLFEMSR